jgi:hypothetical protein
MIDLRYHIATIVALFLALAAGILIGSTIVGDDLLVEQQKKSIDRLEEQFLSLREQEKVLSEANIFQTNMLANYENYNQAMLPVLVKNRLKGMNVAVVVSGGSDIPAGMLNSLTIAGANIVSKTVVLEEATLKNADLRSELIDYYQLDPASDANALRYQVATSVAALINNQADANVAAFLQDKGLVKLSGTNEIPIQAVILVGGTEDPNMFLASSFDQGLITHCQEKDLKVFGVETSQTSLSYMEEYQKNNISTVDNIDLSLGQIALVYALEGEPGHYGIKPTAKRFMPSVPFESLGGQS